MLHGDRRQTGGAGAQAKATRVALDRRSAIVSSKPAVTVCAVTMLGRKPEKV